ncbi:hypothetical protein GLYMA_08G363250v4 [Glycine max]|nr:hypothetical protein GLYMA_08G363250v4 [Glycine max]KAH1054790.1 hypothetical protein GYH30_023522 [Glycine max]
MDNFVGKLLVILFVWNLWSSSHSMSGTKKYALVDEIYMSDVYPFNLRISASSKKWIVGMEITWSVSGGRSPTK